MKFNLNPNETETPRSVVYRGLAEPCLVMGMAIFWAVALSVAAVVFGVNVVVEQVVA
jgi:hypothetical protein